MASTLIHQSPREATRLGATFETARVPWVRVAAPALLIALILGWGAARVYPLYDDAWMQMLTRESGANLLVASMPDRPVYGWMLRIPLFAGTHATLLMVALNSILWLILGGQAARMWVELFPGLSRYAPAAACIAMAPIVATCQWTTGVTNIQIVPVALGYAAAIRLLRYV